MVFQAAKSEGHTDNSALGQFMERYWQPLYFYARRQGLSADDAEDATQAFLLDLMEGNCLADADPAKGRFRNYLLTLWKRFLVDRARYENRVKRGGAVNQTTFHWVDRDLKNVEKAWLDWSVEASQAVDPDQAYYEQWATTMIDTAIAKLRAEYTHSRREWICEALLPYLTVPMQADRYCELAMQLNCTPGALKVALHRLRQRFAAALRQLVQETLDEPGDLQLELAELIRYFPQQRPSGSGYAKQIK